MLRWLFVLTAALCFPAAVFAQTSLIGTYKLLSFTYRLDNGPEIQRYDQAPTGYIVFTPKRFVSVLAAGGRKPASSIADKAALLDSMIAYTGTYRIDGSKVVFSPDVSWVESWTGKDQIRNFRIDGNRLTLRVPPSPFSADPSKMAEAELVWEKVE